MGTSLPQTRRVSTKHILGFCVFWSLILLVFYVRDNGLSTSARWRIWTNHSEAILASLTTADHGQSMMDAVSKRSRQKCIHPPLKIDDPVMMKHFRKYSPPKCKGEDWVYVENGTVRFSPQSVTAHGEFSCNYYPLERDGEDKIKWGEPVYNISDGFNIAADFFRVACTSARDESYGGLHSGVAYTPDRADRKQEPLLSGLEGLSIAVLGFDGMSRMSWLRRLPKTRQYFYDQLGGIELEAHNVVGDGTTAVLFPMLTGKFEWELPESRLKFKGARVLDKFPFLWHDMKKAGYLTSFCEGKRASFNWKMLGFSEQPTDFYTRPFYLAADSMMKDYTKCVGPRTFSQVWLSHFRDIFLMYKNQRKFLFHFLTEMSHDNNNLITMMDSDIQELLQFLHEGNHLNNTLLILMGDHGARYSTVTNVRSTWSGKVEERLPYFAFLFPPWFESKYPQAIQNLRTNTQRLTTPFDVYETFKGFLHFQGTGTGDLSHRGISLFKEIPLERSCKDAGMAPHWCACLAWTTMTKDDPGVKQALGVAIDTINNYTSHYREECALLSVANVTMATKLETRAEVLKFKQMDGTKGRHYKVNMSAKNKNELTLYQLTFYTSPGGAYFEVTVTRDEELKKYFVNQKEISRINKYGNAPSCILDKNRQLVYYCYCKSNLKS